MVKSSPKIESLVIILIFEALKGPLYISKSKAYNIIFSLRLKDLMTLLFILPSENQKNSGCKYM